MDISWKANLFFCKAQNFILMNNNLTTSFQINGAQYSTLNCNKSAQNLRNLRSFFCSCITFSLSRAILCPHVMVYTRKQWWSIVPAHVAKQPPCQPSEPTALMYLQKDCQLFTAYLGNILNDWKNDVGLGIHKMLSSFCNLFISKAVTVMKFTPRNSVVTYYTTKIWFNASQKYSRNVTILSHYLDSITTYSLPIDLFSLVSPAFLFLQKCPYL